MQLTRRLGFLTVTGSLQSGKSKVAIELSLAHAITRWDSSTRLSPLYGLTQQAGDKQLQAADEALRAAQAICFLGCATPALLPNLPAGVGLWATLGTFNIIAYSTDKDTLENFANQTCQEGKAFRYEIWTLGDQQQITSIKSSPFTPENIPEDLKTMASHRLRDDLQISVSEYCTLMASSLTRSAQALPSLQAYIKQVHDFAVKTLNDFLSSEPKLDIYEVISTFTNINAGLSRFHAQTFSGISPIHQTECHFWIHSLLGTGVGNLALDTLTRFLALHTDRLELGARLKTLSQLEENHLPRLEPHNLLKASSDRFWEGNYLQSVAPNATLVDNKQSEPLITYFSSRDWFRTELLTASAPLASLSACNTLQWSLMGMTHEVCHRLAQEALVILYPADPKTQKGIEALQDFVKNKPTRFCQVQELIIYSLIFMDEPEKVNATKIHVNISVDDLKPLILRWYDEVEEIIAHVLDFLYFYGQDTESYVRTMWSMWSVIPNNNSNRISDHVIKTVCANLVKHLSRKDGKMEIITRKEIIGSLEKLANNMKPPSHYVNEAITLLKDDDKWLQVLMEVRARKGLVKLVRGFLYWDNAAKDIQSENAVTSGGTSEHDGYSFKIGEIVKNEFDNPMRFVKAYTKSQTPDEKTAMWLLYFLAFNVRKRKP